MKKGAHPKYRTTRYWRKPRCKAGDNNPNGKIHHSVVDSIRANYKPYVVTAIDLAIKYGLSVGHTRKIISGQLWGGPRKFGQYKKLTSEQAADLRQKRNQGWSYRQLERHFPIGRGSIHHLLAGRTYKS